MDRKEFIDSIKEGAVPVDGDFGPITRQQVIEYQKNRNITVDGIVGTETWSALITE
jgi:peptidoglycan hydrolase-like protein with peptidoglycan-binding domain